MLDVCVVRRIGNSLMFFVRNLVRVIVAFSWSRTLLNSIYLRLTPSQRSSFHARFAKIFRNAHVRKYLHVSGGIWKVAFLGKTILIPLTPGRFWLDWDTAVSVVGSDIDVKQTYEALLESPAKPELFLDIGANYGTHSLLFLIHNIETITFEPNSSCHPCFEELCRLNEVTPKLRPVALGDSDSHVELAYPEHDTWLGSTNPEVANHLAFSNKLTKERVRQRTLDDYLDEFQRKKTLVKIDTEGNELAVLRGGIRTLRQLKPDIIFECWQDKSERDELCKWFGAENYELHSLPWRPEENRRALECEQFMASASTNFIAVPGRSH